MVKIKIYTACLKCDCPKYGIDRPSWTTYDNGREDYVRTDNIIECEHERVCKLIDGQEPIEIGEQCK